MKIILTIIIFLLCFAGTVALILMLTGNLNEQGISKLLNPEQPPIEEVAAPEDQLSAAAREVERLKDDLALRDEKAKEKEERLRMSQEHLDELLQDVQGTLKQISTSMTEQTKEERAKLKEHAETIQNMKDEAAAKTLENFPPEEAAALLSQIDAKKRGKILDKMEPANSAAILGVDQTL